MATTTACGLVNKQNGESIPLVSIQIRANLLDFIGEIKVDQTYVNDEDNPIEATYKFPLSGNAAICEFVAKIDEQVIVAKVMDKQKAANAYDDALSAGHGSYLMEQSDNSLQISIGNLPSKKQVTLTITFVQELTMADKETLRFEMPRSLYSALETFPAIDIKMKMPLQIEHLTTLPLSSVTATINGNTAELHILASTQQNPGNISVLVKLGPKLGRPRLWVEKWDKDFDPLAVMLAVSPDVESQPQNNEIMFLLDRSSSMDGEPTRQLMFTMFHALKFIPSSLHFNIICFGSSHTLLFPQSVLPTFENLFTARRLISKLPSLDGTNLLSVLQEIYSKPTVTSGKRHVILLTDGRIDDTASCVDLVKKNSEKCTVSTIGIGNVDKDLVLQLAEVTSGKCEIIAGEKMDEIEGVMDALLKWTLEPAFENVEITWYEPNDVVCTSVQKAPEKLPPMYAGDLYKIYALVTNINANLVKAKIKATGKAGEFHKEIDLKSVDTNIETIVTGKLIHILAAKQLIRELEEGAFRRSMNGTQQEAEIVRLGTAYNLASKYTSFVAVDERNEQVRGTMSATQIKSAPQHTPSISVTPAPQAISTSAAPTTQKQQAQSYSSFGGGSFWRSFGFHAISSIDSLLENKDCKLEELLNDDEIIQEVKSRNHQLLSFLTLPNSLQNLIECITKENKYMDPKLQTKYANVACEILCLELWPITQPPEAYFEMLFAFLDRPPPLNLLLSGQNSRVIQSLCLRRTTETLEFIMKKRGIITNFVRHLGNESVMEILTTIIGCEEALQDSGFIPWLSKTELIPSLVSKFNPSFEDSVHESAAHALSNVIKISSPDSPLIVQLTDELLINQLFIYILSKNNSVLINGLAVVIDLLTFYVDTVKGKPVVHPLFSPYIATSTSALTPPTPKVLPITLFSPLISSCTENLHHFNVVLKHPANTNQALPPLGFARLKIIEFYHALLRTHASSIEMEFVNQRTMQILLDLFFTYHRNNFLHNFVEKIVSTVLASHNHYLVFEVLVTAGLLNKSVEAYQQNTNPQPKSARPGYMGHLTKIVAAIAGAVSSNSEVKSLIEKNDVWSEFFFTKLPALQAISSVPLGGIRPKSDESADKKEAVQEINVFEEFKLGFADTFPDDNNNNNAK